VHGLPLAWAKFERRNVPGIGWRIAVSGQNEVVRGTYSENANRSQITFAEPGFYLVVVQTETAQAQTEIELETPTELALNTLGRWRVGGIVQPISVVPAANGLADPAVQTLTRSWMPFERVSMAWPIETTTADQPVRWRWSSGQTAGQHTPTVYAWRFFNYAGGIGKTQDSNRVLEAPETIGAVAAVRLDPPRNVWYNPTKLDWYRVAVGSDATSVRWNIQTLYDYEHLMRVSIRSTPGSQASGTITARVLNAEGSILYQKDLSYSPANDTVYTNVFARQIDFPISAIELINLQATDAFDVRVEFNVTD
jgi:hypothetical protein